MKTNNFLFSFLLSLCIGITYGQGSPEVYYVELIPDEEILQNPVKNTSGTSSKEGILVRVYPDITFQTIEGIGGAFNEIGGEALLSIKETERNTVMKNLFGKEGAYFTLCRTAIGASDFGIDAYSYSETAEDYKMKQFSIARDMKYVIPYIQNAYRYNPTMTLFASPWSPPGWMKESGLMDKGIETPEKNILRATPEIYSAYALYFSKYVQAYNQQGIEVNRITVQNEQDITTKYPSCYMPPEEMAMFINDYLHPQFKKDNVNTKIWGGTFRTARQLDGLEFVSNKKWRSSVDGIGIQYTSSEQIANLYQAFPKIKLMHTEGNCFRGQNSVKQAFSRFQEVAGYLNYGVRNYCYWNIILNETGKSAWGWKQNSLININREDKSVTYNPDYAVMCLFSKFMRPGMKRVASKIKRELGITLADEKNVYIFLKNDSDEPKTYDIQVNDTKNILTDIPAQSISVVVLAYNK